MPSPRVRRSLLQGLGPLLAALWLATALPAAARAQGVELATLQATREDGALALEFAVRVTLPSAVEEALKRGVPVYFLAEATVLRKRWYWRDLRVARVSRSWRIAYQPLTDTWRVGLGGLNQTYDTLGEALATASRSAGWRIADLSQIDPDHNHEI
jgi:hypothetical protein